MPEKICILVIRRDDLTPEEKQELEAHYGQATEFVYRQAAPRTPEQWLEECRTFGAQIVVLPSEEPLPMLAMREGFPHITFTAEGIMLITDVKVERIPFV
ncbi:MAG TPA: hypothetical protein VGA94_05895 [Thermodesulfobacteriota bacterium]